MLITLKETKEYLRVGGDEDDSLIESLINVSEEYLKNATGKTFNSTNPLARLFCLVLVVDWYENRGLTAGKVGQKIRPVIDSMLAQLNYCYSEEMVE
ncbi:head-tail connector protein [Clostridium cochlearium]|uniref:head-tail connector protein n=1 Tax=Clostridium cochlearium TaxID=1494 RepID=UPI000B94D1D8|nr:head-tail connector protein [Clostridium cochlearium]SNV67363.1 putative DNA packaging protein [Clostridium cochlearium]STA91625.1 putative DNA packaging protein [Clostridium cochlearium]